LENKMKKFSLFLNVVLLAGLAFGAYKFMIQGSVQIAEDGRTTVLVEAGERDFILAEMRGFLETLEGITSALAKSDFDTAANIATAAGMGGAGAAPVPLMGKLPLEFKTKGFELHVLFDDLAAVAKEATEVEPVLAQLGSLIQNCTGCHAGYQLGIEGGE
jgi:cytochrome c556